MKTKGYVLGLVCVSTLAFAGAKPQKPQTESLGAGFATAPKAGDKALLVDDLPAFVRQAADVALAGYGQNTRIQSAHLDMDDVIPVYEVEAIGADGRHLEVDVDSAGRVEELEIQIRSEEVPAAVMEFLSKHAPDFQASQEDVKVEKSLRPSKNGLIEVWYEFSGTNYDVEIRSDAKVLLIEPA